MEYTDLSQAAAFAVDCSDLLALLSIGFGLPSRELAEGIRNGSFFHDFYDCCSGLGLDYDTAAAQEAAAVPDTESLFHPLNQEYTRLFLAPWNEKVAICESTFLHGRKTAQFVNETALHAEQTYRHNGYDFPEKGTLPGDHMAVELAYLSFLYAGYAAALEAGQTAVCDAKREAIRDFFNQHLKRWFSDFMKEVSRNTTHPFFRLLAQTGVQMDPLPEL